MTISNTQSIVDKLVFVGDNLHKLLENHVPPNYNVVLDLEYFSTEQIVLVNIICGLLEVKDRYIQRSLYQIMKKECEKRWWDIRKSYNCHPRESELKESMQSPNVFLTNFINWLKKHSLPRDLDEIEFF